MAAVNNLFLVEQRLWTIVLAWPGLTTGNPPLLKPGNVERFDQLGILNPKNKPRYAPADQITFSLDYDGQRADSDAKVGRTLCGKRDVNNVTFSWEVIGADKRLNLITQAMAEWRAAMYSTDAITPLVPAGGQLGIPDVVARWEYSIRDASRANDPTRTFQIQQIVTVKG